MLVVLLYVIVFSSILYLIKIINSGKYRSILLWGLILRMSLLLISFFDVFPVPDAHFDADSFHNEAVDNQKGWQEYATNYSVFLTLLYHFTDCSRFFAQYLNLFMGVLVIVYIRKILCILDVSEDVSKKILLIAALMPFLNIYSVVLLREAWILFFLTYSLYHFVKWYISDKNNIPHIIGAIGGVLVAMWMHAGVVGVIAGYFIAFITYNRKYNNVKISKSSYIAIVIGLLFLLILLLNMDLFLSKLLSEDMMAAIEKRGEGAGGESDYLTWLNLSNPFLVLLYSPLKMFYLLYSPIIIDWRGLNDMLAFLLDSSVYILATWVAAKNIVVNKQHRLLKRYLLISILVTTFLFSLGTSNSGTAIRHRAKMCSVVLVVWAISSPPKRGVERFY